MYLRAVLRIADVPFESVLKVHVLDTNIELNGLN